MELFSHLRPKQANGLPLLLLDGSVVPQITVMPKDDIQYLAHLSVMLRNYSSGESFSYRYYETDIPFNSLADFFCQYRIDPEFTLKHYFSWEPQERKQQTKPKLTKTVPEDLQDAFDLL